MIGIDTDDGGEFINNELFDFCQEHRITFTRSRPYNKNDGAHVEQKNWSRVRELGGYLRYDTPAELELLNQIWELDRTFTNYLLPQQKLVSKTRHGAKVTKVHDAPSTPHQRAAADSRTDTKAATRMNADYRKVRPAALSRSRFVHHYPVESRVDNVNRFSLCPCRTALVLPRFPSVFAGSQCWQGRESRSSPTSGTA